MTPQERQELEMLRREVDNLKRVLDVPFIEEAKRRIVTPELQRKKLVTKESSGSTSGILKSVNEGGSSSFSVADAFDGSLTVTDQEGNTYKLGYYNT